MIQSRFGSKGNFELVTPLPSGGVAHLWPTSTTRRFSWSLGAYVGQSLGSIDAVSLIQSNFGRPGQLEVAALGGSQVWMLFRDPSTPFGWHDP